MQYHQHGKIDRPVTFVKRQRELCAAYESPMGASITPAKRSLIARAVSIELSLELMEAEQVAGKPIDAEKHARLAGVLARLLDRLGLTARSGASAAPPPFDLRKSIRSRITQNGLSDAERDRLNGLSDAEVDRLIDEQIKLDSVVL
jgi:hypothetical protein